MYKISLNDLDKLFEAISKNESLYIPVDSVNGAEFKKYEEGMKLSSALNTNRSAKDFFFPQTESMFDFKVSDKSFDIIDKRRECEDFVIFGVRACDARSFTILDKVFLSDPVDTYYQNRRSHGTIVSVACGRPEETCFCQSFGINPAKPEGDASAWICADELFITANTPEGEKLI